MKPEIRAYLDEHGDRYTRQAMRKELLAAGHDAGDVDEALAEWGSANSPRPTSEADRRSFRWWAFGFHAGALAIIAGWLISQADSFRLGGGEIVLVILAVALLIGWAISAAIGGSLLRSSSLAAALIAPAISALLIGGSCVAIIAGLGGI